MIFPADIHQNPAYLQADFRRQTLSFPESPVHMMEELFELAVTGIVDRGYTVIDGFLDEATVAELRQRLLQRSSDGEFQQAGIGLGTESHRDRTIRGDHIFWLEEHDAFPAEKQFIANMNALMEYLNRTCYLGVKECEFHYAMYPPGTFYQRHLDQFQQDDVRVMSVVTYLNDTCQAEDGGEIVLYLPDGESETAHHISPLGGRTVLFESARLEHEVKPATRDRLSLTGWLRRATMF